VTAPVVANTDAPRRSDNQSCSAPLKRSNIADSPAQESLATNPIASHCALLPTCLGDLVRWMGPAKPLRAHKRHRSSVLTNRYDFGLANARYTQLLFTIRFNWPTYLPRAVKITRGDALKQDETTRNICQILENENSKLMMKT
jgi:hypothetical protein